MSLKLRHNLETVAQTIKRRIKLLTRKSWKLDKKLIPQSKDSIGHRFSSAKKENSWRFPEVTQFGLPIQEYRRGSTGNDQPFPPLNHLDRNGDSGRHKFLIRIDQLIDCGRSHRKFVFPFAS